MIPPVGHAEALHQGHRLAPRGRAVAPDIARGEQDIVDRGEARHEQEGLEDIADAGAAHPRLGAPGQVADADVVEPDLAGVGRVEQAEHVEERRLARARSAHDGDELAGHGVEIDGPKHVHGVTGRSAIALGEPADPDQHPSGAAADGVRG